MNNNNNLADKELVSKLMAIKSPCTRVPFDSKRDRFNIPFSLDTSVHQHLNANRIIINDSNIAIATQFPLIHQLEVQFQMMVENRTPVLVVLASDSDIKKDKLPPYFSASIPFESLKTRSTPLDVVELGDDIQARLYSFEISGYQATIDIPVIHVHNWPDHQTVSAKTTENLVTLIEAKTAEKRAFYEDKKSRAVTDDKKLLPVIHCKAGVGRTGQTIAAMAMKKFPELSLTSIVSDLRKTRNDTMIQTPPQMDTLIRIDNSR